MLTKRMGRNLLVWLILWLAFVLRLYHLDFQSIWWDEGHSIFVAQHPIPQIPGLPAMDVHPPAYFILLRMWLKIAGQSEFALRYLSVSFSLLTIALLWRCTRSVIPVRTNTIRLVALLATISPFYVAYAQEVRSYTMITLLALASTYALWKIITKPQTYLWLGAYILLTTACLYTHYFTIFLLLFQNVVWFGWVINNYFTTRKDMRVNFEPYPAQSGDRSQPTLLGSQALIFWVASQVGIFLLFLPQLRLALRQVTSYTNPNLTPPALSHFVSRSWQAYTIGLTIEPTPARWGMWGIFGVLVIGHVLFFMDHKSRSQNKRYLLTYSFLLGWFFIPLVAYFIILQGQPSFEPRYMALITPALFLLFGLSLSHPHSLSTPHPQPLSLRERRAETFPLLEERVRVRGLFSFPPKKYVLRTLSYVLAFITLTILILGLHSYYTDETFFKDDSAGVAVWLATETTPNDIVYIDVPHPFHYYAEQYDIPAPTDYLFVDIHTAAERLNREAAGRKRLYWVTWWGSDTDPRGVIPFLAEKTGDFVDQRDFRGYHVEWFTLPAGARFELPNSLNPVAATFGEVIQLDGMAYSETTRPGNPAWATLHFSLLRETGVNYKASLRLRDVAGQIMSQVDRDLLNDRHFRTGDWPLDDPALNQAINVYTLPIPSETPPASYQLELVIYNGEPPYPSEGVSGIESQDGVSATLGNIEVMP